ncbi:hypothetical protein EWM64_g4590 [Hericium alpestre]|uniref:Protein kinase domain-containing protein n=1 Tax=Hericium alpestre TaxID=135208 RepID=A0A4Y9ZZM1_9AGAM|nr:hypothetical protein EWM64_g4590 [Hericium alpestre]
MITRVLYETKDIGRNPIRLSIIIAAYLYRALEANGYPIYISAMFREEDKGTLPAGPVIDQTKPPLSDTPVFLTHSHHSDFDNVMLFADEGNAFQFLRWKAHVQKHTPWWFAKVGDTVKGKTQDFFKHNVPLSPCFPMEELPADTTRHIEAHQRNPSAIARRIMTSSSFSIELTKDLTAHRGATMCRTYRCRLLSTDGIDVHPTISHTHFFCVKFFDDRFYSFDHYGHDDQYPNRKEAQLSVLVKHWDTAEECVRREDAAYKKLAVIQGSLIPRYYGAHTFDLPTGHILCGIMMEYIPAETLSQSLTMRITTDQQVQLIRSLRHAVRVLQYSDVSQHDWHLGQILCLVPEPDSPGEEAAPAHCVLVDFAQTRQSYWKMDSQFANDAGEAMRTLLSVLDEDLVWDNWAPREMWDCVVSGLGRSRTALVQIPLQAH